MDLFSVDASASDDEYDTSAWTLRNVQRTEPDDGFVVADGEGTNHSALKRQHYVALGFHFKLTSFV